MIGGKLLSHVHYKQPATSNQSLDGKLIQSVKAFGSGGKIAPEIFTASGGRIEVVHQSGLSCRHSLQMLDVQCTLQAKKAEIT